MNILCVGKIYYDTIFKMDHFIKENTINEVSSTYQLDGIAYNVANLLGKFNKNVYLAGIVGNDKSGSLIKKELENANVNTSYLKMDDNISTPSNIIINNKENDSKTILSYNIDNKHISNIDVNIKPNIILTDGSEYDLSISLINNKDVVSIMAVDTYTESNFELSKKTDFVICNESFASKVLEHSIDQNDLENSYLKLKQYFKNIIVILENKNCLYEYDGQIKVMPSINKIENNKPNDIFYGAFIYAIVSDYNFEESIMFASIALGLKDNNDSLNLKEIESKYNEYR